MNGDVNQESGGKRAIKRRMSSDGSEVTKRPATGFTMSIDERNELREIERKGEVDDSSYTLCFSHTLCPILLE